MKIAKSWWSTYPKYLLLTILILLGLSTAITLTKNRLTNAVTDTGKASLTNVEITKAGTATTVTYEDGSTLTGDPANRKVLNNDEVIYRATYQVTTPGTISLSLTMPANNTINEASISQAAGCGDGSKLEMVAVNGQTSYTNNKATCVVNPTTANTTIAWSISTNPWGGNNEQIAPTLAIAGLEQVTKSAAITTIGKPKYRGWYSVGNTRRGSSNGWNEDVFVHFNLYVPTSDTGILGVEPVKDGNYSVSMDTSNMPSGWVVPAFVDSHMGAADIELVHGGNAVPVNENGDKKLVVNTNGAATATTNYPRLTTSGSAVDEYYYAGFRISLRIPVKSLTAEPKWWSMAMSDFQITGQSGQTANVVVSPKQLSWELSSRSYGRPQLWGSWMNNATNDAPGWQTFYMEHQPLYTGETFSVSPFLQMNVTANDPNATNLNYCYAYDAAQLRTAAELQLNSGSIINSSFSIEYGRIEQAGTPNSSLSICGTVGDDKKGVSFFDTLEEAEKNGVVVNAVRFRTGKAASGSRDMSLGSSRMKVSVLTAQLAEATVSASATADQWSISDMYGNSSQNIMNHWQLVPGLLSHTITTEPSSTAPNTEDHITITPHTFNKDTNSTIVTTLPKGLTIKNGSFKVGNTYLTSNANKQDYTVSKDNANGTTTITFNMDQIATSTGLPINGEEAIYPAGCTSEQIAAQTNNCLPTAKDGEKDSKGMPQGIPRTPIEFDVVVDSNVATPSTLTINSQTKGDGTNYASTTFRSATAKVSIAVKEEFSYSLTSSASSIYTGEDLTYHVANRNNFTKAIDGLTTINVLPFTGDNRGTTNLASYKVSNLTLTPNQASGAELYYTTDTRVRELAVTNPNNLTTDSQIKWVKCMLDSNNSCTNLPSQITNAQNDTNQPDGTAGGITAIKLVAANLPTSASPTASYTITDITATTSGNPAKLVNNISATTYKDLGGVVVSVAETSTDYLGNTLVLSLDKEQLQADLPDNSVMLDNPSLTNQLSIKAETARGYDLTLKSKTEQTDLTNNSAVGQTDRIKTIPTKAGQPTKGTPSWAVKSNRGLDWSAMPASNQTPLTLYTSTTNGPDNASVQAIYGVATGNNHLAGDYTTQVVYTLTAKL